MAAKESNQNMRMFFPGQAFLSYDKEPAEFKQSRSNGCLGSSDGGALKKHISLEKIMQSIPSKSRSKINLKITSRKVGPGSAKNNLRDPQLETRIKLGFKSYNGHQAENGSPMTPSRVLPFTSEQGSAS